MTKPTDPSSGGMSALTARTIEYGIILLCLVSLIMIFQPYSITLYSIGAGLVVLGGLAFNLVPLCQPGRPLEGVVKVALIVLLIFIIVTLLAIGSAFLYGVYLRS